MVFLSKRSSDELVGLLPTRLKPLVTLLYYCGVRGNEAGQIERVQVDLDARLIKLEEKQTKSAEALVVPLPSVLVAMLREINKKRACLLLLESPH